MCILMYFAPGAMPIREHLREGARSNPDGYGWAVVVRETGRILTGRTMDATEAVDEFMKVREQYPADAALFHARITTHGTTDVDNCHPFTVGNRPKGARGDMVLAHNGMIGACTPMKGDLRSDTRVLAEDVLMRRFPVLDSEKTRRRLEQFIGNGVTGYGSKVIVLTTDPAYNAQAYIFNQHLGDWLEDDDNIPGNGDIWYSNTSWRPRRYYADTYTTSWASLYARSSAPIRYGDAYAESDGQYAGYVLICRACAYRLRDCLCVGTVGTMYVPKADAKIRAASEYGDIEQCPNCLGRAVDDDGYCEWCGSVICCGMATEECDCSAENYIGAVDALLMARGKSPDGPPALPVGTSTVVDVSVSGDVL